MNARYQDQSLRKEKINRPDIRGQRVIRESSQAMLIIYCSEAYRSIWSVDVVLNTAECQTQNQLS